jgi:hypothetical protein
VGSLSRFLRCEKIQSPESLNKPDLSKRNSKSWHRYSLSLPESERRSSQ